MERVGPYEVHEQLGRGGMGVVHRAVDTRSGQEVALKRLVSTDERARRRLFQEAKALAQLRHANVVSIFDAGEDRGYPWLAIELVRGGSLQDRLDREGPLTPLDAARLVLAVARGLGQAHRRGVLHRDLKPANVLLPDDGGEPKLTDFGLAGFLFDDLGASRLTKSGTITGSPGYWSPEQASGRVASIGPATDVYGLGALLYAALTGRPPLEGESIPELLVAVAKDRPEPPGVDPTLDAIALRCLEKRREDRYATVDEVASALWQHLLAPRATASRRASPMRIGAALAVVLGALGVGLVTWLFQQQQEVPPVTTVTERPRVPPTTKLTPTTEVTPATEVPPPMEVDELPSKVVPFPISTEARDRLTRWVRPLEPEARAPMLAALVGAAEGLPLAACEPALRQAQRAAPESAELALLSARIFAGRDAYSPAFAAIATARDLGGARAPLDQLEGEVLWFQGRGNDAVKVWDALARREPSSAEGLCAAAWSHYARDESAPALRAAREARRKAPESTTALLIEAIVLGSESQLAESEAVHERILALEGALTGRVPLFKLASELERLIYPIENKGVSTPEIDARLEQVEALFALCGSTARTTAVARAMLMGPGSRWWGRCSVWLDDARRLEPQRSEVDIWHGWVALNDPRATADDVLGHWRHAKEKDPRMALAPSMREGFRVRFPRHPGLSEFP